MKVLIDTSLFSSRYLFSGGNSERISFGCISRFRLAQSQAAAAGSTDRPPACEVIHAAPQNEVQLSQLSSDQNSATHGNRERQVPANVLTDGGHFRPELMRGISLRSTLRQGGRLWRHSPCDLSVAQREQLFAASKPTARYDKFLSHTWWTHGRWKSLSLLIHFGWPAMLIAWIFGITLSFALCLMDLLPALCSFEVLAVDFRGQVPYGCWIMLAGFIAPIGGLLVFPYVPCPWSDTCFLDFVCIHQTDSVQMQQGIRCIGSFLAASKELRVLWSSPYLSRPLVSVRDPF